MRLLAPSFALLALSAAAAAQTMLGPTPYLSSADSPFPLGSPAFALETFEDHALNLPGLTMSTGYVTSSHFAGTIIDSVDGDDGLIGNGACANCDSYFSTSLLTLTFDETALGGLPRRAGLVWTDGGNACTVTFKAYDVSNTLLGTVTAPGLGDASNNGTTAEDRFFGIDFSGGIKKLTIQNSSGGMEIDHVQFELPCAALAPQSYCTAKVNSLGCTPSIAGSGTPSASATSGFTVSATNLRNRKPGILLYTSGGRAATPFSGGTLCLAGSIKRVQDLNTGGTPSPANDCTGVLAVDMNAFRAGTLGGNPAPFLSVVGTVVQAQFWARDPGFAAPNNTQLTNGLEYVICQ